ncbi:MAG: PDZ domain-containing protein [Thermoguttaceae bacterium]
MVQHFSSWLGGLAIVLLPAATGFAQEAAVKADVQTGSVRVQVDANSAETDGESVQVQINGQPDPIHVEPKEGQRQSIRVHAGPVHVETQGGPEGGVRVHAGPVYIRGRWSFGDQPVKLGKYWIGLALQPVPDTLRVQLGLPEGQGLVVAKVLPKSPAAEADLQQHDVLLTASDKPLGGLTDLLAAIDEAKETPLAFGLIRAGKAQKIVVTPARRPELPPGPVLKHVPRLPAIESGPPHREWQEYIERFLPRRLDGNRPYRFRFYHPGVILPPGAAVSHPIPGDLNVTINKQGDQPAKVVVKRGDQTWEVTEETLDELPDDIRIHIEPMLGRTLNFTGLSFDFVPNLHMPGQPEGQLPEDLEWHEVQPQTRLERRIEELNRRVEELHKSVDELRKKRQ